MTFCIIWWIKINQCIIEVLRRIMDKEAVNIFIIKIYTVFSYSYLLYPLNKSTSVKSCIHSPFATLVFPANNATFNNPRSIRSV